jgi:hypothetical protein
MPVVPVTRPMGQGYGSGRRSHMIAASHSAAKACSVCWSIWSRCSGVLPVTLA